VAFGATQNAVDAGRMFGGINRDALAARRRHSRPAVAGEAAFVLLERMGRFRLGPNPSGQQRANGKKTDRDKQDQIDGTRSSTRSSDQSSDDICCASRPVRQNRSPAAQPYFIPRSVRTLGFTSPAARI
jgi:hypothetical protein